MRKTKLSLLVIMLMLAFPVAANEMLWDFQGKAKKLSDYTGQGKWLIVMIWAHDCHVCNEEAHQYVKFHNKHKAKDAQVLGLSADGKTYEKEAKQFIKRHKLSFDNIIGEPEEVAGIYEDLTGVGSFGTPSFLIYNPKGELRAQQIGAVPVNLIETFMQKESNI